MGSLFTLALYIFFAVFLVSSVSGIFSFFYDIIKFFERKERFKPVPSANDEGKESEADGSNNGES